MPPGVTPELWQKLSPYLDQLLLLDEAAREPWLTELDKQDPALAKQLKTLLEEHRALAQENFLEHGPEMPDPPAEAGEALGPYCLIEPIGFGGMGTVWLAERSDGRFNRRVAVKFPNVSLSGHAEERFRREGSIVGRLAHPHIAQLIDAGLTHSGRPFLVLEYVEGEPIDQYCDARSLGIRTRIRLFLDVLGAVAHAHANLVVHRDLKPSNVFVTGEGSVKLLDFGVAKLLEEHSGATTATLLTREAGVALTPEFAAPEQLTGGPVTTATDVYALGILLYGLLCGRHPAGAQPSTPAEWMHAVVEREATRPSDLVFAPMDDAAHAAQHASCRSTTPARLQRRLRGDLDTIVLKALKKDPRERYVSVSAFAEDLHRHLAHVPISARPDTLLYIGTRFVQRNRNLVALASLAVLAGVAGGVATLRQAHNTGVERDFALRQLARAEAINELNQFVLSDAAPSGQAFTVNDLLERAEAVVSRQGAGEEIHRVEMLISIGRQYWSHDEHDRSRLVLTEALERASRLADPSTRARAACSLASAMVVGDSPEEAERLFREGLAELPVQPRFILDRVYCLQCGSEVANGRGDARVAVERASDAQRLLATSPFSSEFMRLGVLMALAEAYRNAGQLHLALPAFEQAAALMGQLGRGDTQKAGTLYNNWGISLGFLGRPLESERMLRRAIAISSDHRGEGTVSPMLLVNYARAMRHLGRHEEAADYASRGLAKGRQVGHQVVTNQAQLELGRAYLDLGDIDGARAMLDEVEPRLQNALPAGHVAFAVVLLERSRVAHARGDLGAATELADEAVALTEAAVAKHQVGIEYLAPFLLHRADVLLEGQSVEPAASDVERAVGVWNEAIPPGTTSSNLGRALMTLAGVRQAQQRPDEARTALREALAHLEDAAGPDHPDTERCRIAVSQLTANSGE
jgi:eukaryotic-like serine/threonine-protein kinase